jgi:hypothetical protein
VQRASGIPCALVEEGGTKEQTSRETCGGIVKLCLVHGGLFEN